jgi:X-Pro dipeptidyl-peptidase
VSNRVLFSTGALPADLRLAGIGEITATVTPSTPTAHLSAFLVDYGPATIRSSEGQGIRTLTNETCWGENRPGDDACYKETEATVSNVDAHVIARGWADLANYSSLSSPRPLTPGQKYTMTFRLSTADAIVPKGHRLALVIAGTDGSMIAPPAQLPGVTVHLAETSVRLPVVGAIPVAGIADPAPSIARVQPDVAPATLR